jgi:hypothetical protein
MYTVYQMVGGSTSGLRYGLQMYVSWQYRLTDSHTIEREFDEKVTKMLGWCDKVVL